MIQEFDKELDTGSLLAAAVTDGAAEGAKEAKTLFQFTKEAHRRAKNAPTQEIEDKLRNEIFAGQFNVGLLEVEKAIFQLEALTDRRTGYSIDLDELVACGANIRHVCVGEYLPKMWHHKSGDHTKDPGNFSPDLGEDTLPCCVKCQRNICEGVERRNATIVAKCEVCRVMNERKEEGKHNDHAGEDEENRTVKFPRFLSLDASDAAVERRKYAIRMQEEDKNRKTKVRTERTEDVSKFVKGLVQRTRASDVQWAKRRYGR